ncbi:hypothetical protein NKR19_g208 [Coniochaeta hoffmannii]|uniref:Cora-domain-containing protein n=1 Tax=Coniochaeta hoffmannii TaxID=91930 RepID=A0AA38SEY8_9PEZI|nr:hypothetical protein NKR19_g208 [Coniochaeta hoffmannii]
MADRGTGVVIHFDSHWERECAIVVVHRPLTRQVDVLVAGLTTSLVPKFTASVREAVHLAGSPLLVPALVMSELAQNQTDWLALVHPDLEEIQRRLGMANWKYASDSPFYGPHAKDNLLGLDLPAIVTKLQRMADSIRFQDQIALTLIEMLEEMEGKLAGMPGVLVSGGEEEAHGDELEREKAERSGVNEEIEQTMTVLVKSLRGCQRRTMYRSGTIQGLIDTVYTLLAQRDNYLSLDVAFHSRRDSTDMRTIAAVTMFFLPGMFTATLFSTSFFDFQSSTIAGMLSPYHWIYWSTTAASTLAVLAFWFFYSHKNKNKDNKLPDLMGIAEMPSPIELRTYNTTDIPKDAERARRFAGW